MSAGPSPMLEEPAPRGIYGAINTERFPVAAVDTAAIPPRFLRTRVAYASSEAPGTIVIDPAESLSSTKC